MKKYISHKFAIIFSIACLLSNGVYVVIQNDINKSCMDNLGYYIFLLFFVVFSWFLPIFAWFLDSPLFNSKPALSKCQNEAVNKVYPGFLVIYFWVFILYPWVFKI